MLQIGEVTQNSPKTMSYIQLMVSVVAHGFCKAVDRRGMTPPCVYCIDYDSSSIICGIHSCRFVTSSFPLLKKRCGEGNESMW